MIWVTASADHAELINIFEIFLPQLLRYPNAADPLNGEAAALLIRDPKAYAKKVESYVDRYASTDQAAQAGDDDAEDGDDEREMRLGGPSSYRSQRGLAASTPSRPPGVSKGANGHTSTSNGVNGHANGATNGKAEEVEEEEEEEEDDDDDPMSDMGELSDGDEFMGEMDD